MRIGRSCSLFLAASFLMIAARTKMVKKVEMDLMIRFTNTIIVIQQHPTGNLMQGVYQQLL